MVEPKLFGSPSRTRVLTLTALLDDTYPRELARLSGVPLVSVQRIVNGLEREGVLATRVAGATRRVILDPRFYGASELRGFLLKYAKRNPELKLRVASLRRRPRRAGKAL